MRHATREQIEKWADALTEEEAKAALAQLVDNELGCSIHFWDDSPAPYWETTGEPIVPGQTTFPDEDDE